MKKITTALFAAVVFLTACQKEPAFIDPSSGAGSGGTTSGLLVRNVEVVGTDSSVIDFSYNTSGRLTRFDVSGTSTSPLTYKLLRNSSGIITQTIASGPDLSAVGLDSLVTNVFYNASTSRYTYTQYNVNLGGVSYGDSTVFTYDGTGNLTSVTDYQRMMSQSYTPATRNDYTYNSGNVVTEKDYNYNPTTSVWTLSGTAAYTYDAKTNPLKLGAEAMIIGLTTYFGPNNLTGLTYTDASDPSNNYTQTSTYTYNSTNKPATGTGTENDNTGTVSYALRYYYN